jgi:anhydro-N-acetylmuramic acid kinase
MRAFTDLAPTERVVVIGLMSGTSADGVDAACVRLSHPLGQAFEWELLGSAVASYPGSLADALRAPEVLTLPDVARLNIEVGAAFAEAATAAAAEARVSLDDIALIGSHGQTVWHDPDSAVGGVGATLQIGEPAEIAERTGCPVWSDFRTADVAAGGQGAPLVPYVDWLLFTDPDRWTVCLNLGGIANLTVLPPGAERGDVIAFDTGPGNMVLDELARRLLDSDCDNDGTAAMRGTVDAGRLEAALGDGYFLRPAPKSTGREAFGAPFVEHHFAPLEDLSAAEIDDRMATAAALTVESVGAALDGSAGTPPVPEDATILVSGGGRKNVALMGGLAERCRPRTVVAIEEHGIDGDLKEAIAFAILAYESALGRAVNLPSVTGARHAVRCGKLTLPSTTDA